MDRSSLQFSFIMKVGLTLFSCSLYFQVKATCLAWLRAQLEQRPPPDCPQRAEESGPSAPSSAPGPSAPSGGRRHQSGPDAQVELISVDSSDEDEPQLPPPSPSGSGRMAASSCATSGSVGHGPSPTPPSSTPPPPPPPPVTKARQTSRYVSYVSWT